MITAGFNPLPGNMTFVKNLQKLTLLTSSARFGVAAVADQVADMFIQDMQSDYSTTIKPTRYVRTYDLFTGWEKRYPKDANNFTVKVINVSGHAQPVQGHRKQQRDFFRKRGWRSIDEVAPKYRAFLKVQSQAVINEAIR